MVGYSYDFSILFSLVICYVGMGNFIEWREFYFFGCVFGFLVNLNIMIFVLVLFRWDGYRG